MTPEELVAAACPLVAELGWAYYFTPDTAAVGDGLGLDLFGFYFLGRGGLLGDVPASVVASAFGFFNPDLVARMWDGARAVVPPPDAARAHLACGHDYGRRTFGAVEGLDAFCAAAERVVAAAPVAGFPLFAATAAADRPDDLPARAMQLVTTLREYRGGAHIVAVLASGVEPRRAHCARNPKLSGAFGWSEEDVASVSDGDRAELAAAEALTDRLVLAGYGALDDAGRDALVSGLGRLREARDAAAA